MGARSARFLNLSERDLSQRVYRIVALVRLLQLFETGENVLVNAKKWEDPFENVVLRSIFPRLGLLWTVALAVPMAGRRASKPQFECGELISTALTHSQVNAFDDDTGGAAACLMQ